MNQLPLSRHLLPAALGLLGLAASTQAQTLTQTYIGASGADRFGASVARSGNNLIIGAPQDLNVFTPGTGYVRVVSGQTGLVTATYQGDSLFDSFGAAVAGAGDVNGDGIPDILIGAPTASVNQNQAGQVQVRSGSNGAVIRKINGASGGDQLGAAVAGVGDVNGDGFADFVVGAPFHSQVAGNAGMARVYSGFDGSVLYTFLGTTNNGRVGISVAGGGDVNGDGVPDIVVGSLFAGVRVYSGATGGLLYTFPNPGNTHVYGRSVALVPGITPDGRAAIAIGATQEDIFSPGTGYVQLRGGATGAILWTSQGALAGDRYGLSLAGVFDWNGDGRQDLAVGARPQNQTTPGYVRILGGLDGALLGTIPASESNNGHGQSLAGLGDWDGNGRVDVAVGVALDSQAGVGAGKVQVFESPTTSCGQINFYCSEATANSTGVKAVISTSGSTSVSDNTMVLIATNMPTNAAGLFFYGAGQTSLPFQNGVLCVSAPIYRITPAGTTGPAGLLAANVPFTNPPVPAATILGGSTWNFQAWYRDLAAGGAASNTSTAVQVNFCP